MMEDRLVTCRIFTSRSKVMATTKQLKKGEMHSGHTLKVSTNVLQGETEGQQSWPAQQRNSMPGDENRRFGRHKVILYRGGVNGRATSGGVGISSLQSLLHEALFTKIHIFSIFLVCGYFVQNSRSHWKLLLEKSPLASLRIGRDAKLAWQKKKK